MLKNLKQKLAMQLVCIVLIAHMLAQMKLNELQFILLHCFILIQVVKKLTASFFFFFAYNLHYKQVSQCNTIVINKHVEFITSSCSGSS